MCSPSPSSPFSLSLLSSPPFLGRWKLCIQSRNVKRVPWNASALSPLFHLCPRSNGNPIVGIVIVEFLFPRDIRVLFLSLSLSLSLFHELAWNVRKSLRGISRSKIVARCSPTLSEWSTLEIVKLEVTRTEI